MLDFSAVIAILLIMWSIAVHQTVPISNWIGRIVCSGLAINLSSQAREDLIDELLIDFVEATFDDLKRMPRAVVLMYSIGRALLLLVHAPELRRHYIPVPEQDIVPETDSLLVGVTALAETGSFIEFLNARSGFVGERGIKELEISLLAPVPGNIVLDVGCGTGDDAREVARLVGPSGRVVGLDASSAMIDESRRRAAGSALPVEFVLGNAYSLDFPDHSFDRARADRLFVHLEYPQMALAEMVRVLRRGGRIVVSEPDCDTIFVDSPQSETTRKVIQSVCNRSGSGMVGRELLRLLQQVELANVASVPRVLTMNLTLMHRLFDGHLKDPAIAAMFAEGELDCWWREASCAEAAGRLHAGVTIFTCVGEKF